MKNGNNPKAKLIIDRGGWLSHNKTTVKRLAVACTVMFSWLLIWALVLKLGSETMLVRNYTNLKDMTFEERILWDLRPFNYDENKGNKLTLIMDTVLNCFVFAPLGIAFCYVFEKKNAFRDVLICLGFSIFIEAVQLFTMLGNPATEDLITNVTGCFIGHMIYNLLIRRLSMRKSSIFLMVVTAILSLAVVFSFATTVMAAEVIFKIITRTL